MELYGLGFVELLSCDVVELEFNTGLRAKSLDETQCERDGWGPGLETRDWRLETSQKLLN